MNHSTDTSNLIICHECDALQELPYTQAGDTVFCLHCNNRLFTHHKGGLDKPLALYISALILYVIANIHPILELHIAGINSSTTLTGSALAFFEQGDYALASIAWIATVLIPGISIAGITYVLISIRFRLNLVHTKSILLWVSRLTPWGMMDVFLLGFLVALVKLSDLADIILDTGFVAFAILVFIYAAASASFEPHTVWGQMNLDNERPANNHEQ